jgi:hypothetical protein
MAFFSSLSVGWVIIGILVIIIFVVIGIVQKRQSMATAAVKIVSVLIVLSVGYIFIVNKIQLNSLSSIIDGVKIYLNWLVSVADKAIDVTTYAIKTNWTSNTSIRG